MENNNLVSYGTEFIGTFVFLSVILNAVEKNSSLSAYAPVAIGLALAVMIQFGGNISGGHYNPAVSLLMFLEQNIKMNQLGGYIVAQVLGMLAARYFYIKSRK
jgi:aquaporin Z